MASRKSNARRGLFASVVAGRVQIHPLFPAGNIQSWKIQLKLNNVSGNIFVSETEYETEAGAEKAREALPNIVKLATFDHYGYKIAITEDGFVDTTLLDKTKVRQLLQQALDKLPS